MLPWQQKLVTTFIKSKLFILPSVFYYKAASALLDHEPKLKENTSAIVGAAIRGSSEIVQLLLDYGVNPNGICIKQRTRPLHEAVRYERWETVKILLSYGADPLMQNDKGQTAESIALQCGNEKASKFISMFKGKISRKLSQKLLISLMLVMFMMVLIAIQLVDAQHAVKAVNF
ncbi:ankyrin repeat and SOCS box protein 14-like [Lingula anatina]|uniref:Ankyrin repeat and SOCS box protein 14-like n=1 Tax=Lingula anatina TaxID=7574 RepID=A0A2R2MS09_LINAN|nr:ankyrin repeat and SOCS box protein 14-like [Lingula anatina]|eukprot:XP_023933044.1 ankyrin repeat and SOCS box protein 14-like [Lingula anatina]